jgi:hypothetical protein
MMNPVYFFGQMRELLNEYEPGRERSLAATKLDECEFWLSNATPTELALYRDGVAARPTRTAVMLADEIKPTGYQGPAAHTFTAGCDGFHPVGEQCNLPAADL